MLPQNQSSLPSLVVLDNKRKLVRSWQFPQSEPGSKFEFLATIFKKFQLIVGRQRNGFLKNISKLRLVQIPHPDTWETESNSNLQITEFPFESQSGIILGVHQHKVVVLYSTLQYKIPLGAIRLFVGFLGERGIKVLREQALNTAVNLRTEATVEQYFTSTNQPKSAMTATHMLVANKASSWSSAKLIIFGFNYSSSQPGEGVWKSIPLSTGYGSDYCKVMQLGGYLVALMVTPLKLGVVVYHNNALLDIKDQPSLGGWSLSNVAESTRLLATDFHELLLVQIVNNGRGHTPTSPKSKSQHLVGERGAAQTICYRLKLV